MKRLTAIILMICLLCSFAMPVMASEDGVIGTRTQYMSWASARREIISQGIEGGFVQIGDYDLMMWIPDTLTAMTEIPEEEYVAYYKSEDGSAEVSIQVFDMEEEFTLEALEQLLTEQGYSDEGIYVINGYYGVIFRNEETDNLSVAFAAGDTEALAISFYPSSDEEFWDLSGLMIASIQARIPTLYGLADMIDTDLLQTVWGDKRKVTINEADSSICVLMWDEGLDYESLKAVTNWDELKEDKLALAAYYLETIREIGMTDAHLILQYYSDVEDTAFLTIVDGEVVFDCFEQEQAAE